jgi:hypothetical protein
LDNTVVRDECRLVLPPPAALNEDEEEAAARFIGSLRSLFVMRKRTKTRPRDTRCREGN